MASTYTANKKLEQPANNDYVNNWNLPVNADWSTIDTCFGGYQVLNPTGMSGTVALTSSTSGTQPYTTTAQWQAPNIVLGTSLSGAATLTANVNYQLPSGIGGLWTIYNNTTGAYTVTFSSAGGGSSVILPQGYRINVVSDGTNVQVAQTSSTNFGLSGALRFLGSTSGYMGFTGPSTGNNTMWTLPSTDGAAGQVLSTNGSGLLSWASAATIASSLTAGSVLYANASGQIAQNNSQFYWDNSNVRLGIGTSAPKTALQVSGPTSVNAPTLGSATNVPFYVSNSDPSYGLLIGTSSSDGHVWMQAQRTDSNAIAYNIILNQGGGNVGIGTSVATNKLQIAGGAVQNSDLGNIGQYEMVGYSGSVWYNSGFRNDGTYAYFLVSSAQASFAAASTAYFSSARPMTVNLSNGANTIGPPSAAAIPLTINAFNNANTNALLVNGAATSAQATVLISDTGNVAGAGIGFAGNGATTPNKFIRAIGGLAQWVNSSYSSVIWSMDDSGNTTNYGTFYSLGKISQGTAPGTDGSGIRTILDFYMDQATSSIAVNMYYSSGWFYRNTGYGFVLRADNAGNWSVLGGGSGSAGAGAAFSTIFSFNATAHQSFTDMAFNAAYGPTSTLSIGYRGLPQNSPGGNYTGVLSDAGKSIIMGNALTFTIPANSSVAYPVGTTLTIVNGATGAGQNCTIAITTDTLYQANTSGTTGSRTLAPLGIATAIKVGSTVWVISGVGVT
jgi:hypothetical protein